MCDECRANPFWPMVSAFLEEWPNAEYGPAHVVLSDFNTEQFDLTYCLGATETVCYLAKSGNLSLEEYGHSVEELQATSDLLHHMLGHVITPRLDISGIKLGG